MIVFTPADESTLITDGHDHDEAALRSALATALAALRRPPVAESLNLCETWHSADHGFGHDCAQHQNVDPSLWAPHCETFRPVTVAMGIPAAVGVKRAVKTQPAGEVGVAEVVPL